MIESVQVNKLCANLQYQHIKYIPHEHSCRNQQMMEVILADLGTHTVISIFLRDQLQATLIKP
jgi:hypothetical protein